MSSAAPFPANIVEALADLMPTMVPGSTVVKRPCRDTDPHKTVGLTANLFTPREDSFEIIGGMSYGPTLNNYIINIQTYVKDANQEASLASGAAMATDVRLGLLFDPSVRVALAGLTYTHNAHGPHTERFARAFIQAQRFVSNEIDGTYLNLTITELLIETEIN